MGEIPLLMSLYIDTICDSLYAFAHGPEKWLRRHEAADNEKCGPR
jgi:hypothetical protein